MEGAIGDSKEGLRLGVMSVLAVALKERQSRNEITFLQKVIRVW